MPAYQHDGLRLAYSVAGTGDPVLFVHGATGTGQYDWEAMAAGFASSYRCVLPDLRGHGESDFRRPGYGAEAILSDLRALIDHLQLGQPHVIGFSYGAEVALLLELAGPGTARSLALVSPGTGRQGDYRAPSLTYLERVWPESLRRLHEERHGTDHWRTLVRLLTDDSARRPELRPEVLTAVRCPVLLLAGEHDDPARRRQGRYFAEVNPLARYAEIGAAGHAAHLERPADVERMIGEFLAQADAAADGALP